MLEKKHTSKYLRPLHSNSESLKDLQEVISVPNPWQERLSRGGFYIQAPVAHLCQGLAACGRLLRCGGQSQHLPAASNKHTWGKPQGGQRWVTEVSSAECNCCLPRPSMLTTQVKAVARRNVGTQTELPQQYLWWQGRCTEHCKEQDSTADELVAQGLVL